MQQRIRSIIFIIIDIVLINSAFLLSFFLRFDGIIDENYMNIFISHIVAITSIKVVIFYFFKLYKSVWRFAGIDELVNVVIASIIGNVMILSYFFILEIRLPRSIFVINTMIDMMLIGGIRLIYRFINRLKKVPAQRIKSSHGKEKLVMIIGAGDAGAMVIKELRQVSGLYSKPIVLIDDDPLKQGQILYHIPVVGTRDDIVAKAIEYQIDEIIIAIPSAKRSDIKEIVKVCEQTTAKLKIVPGIYEMIDGHFDMNAVRDVQIEDLLGRDEVDLDIEDITGYLHNKTVLVTGAGGSIGSELVRQIVNFQPKQLLLLDIYENSLYDLENELRMKDYSNKLTVMPLISSVRDRQGIRAIMERYKPNVVFHAAAHKHVPLMEANPKEAIKNNIIGTFNVVNAAHVSNVDRFVLISTDKAVNPTNVMGATKRVCEMIIQGFNNISETDFVGVRFGNVLGSNGSVIPLFKKQIQEMGYVTVTHPEIIRYFMTIPEAAKLVLQSGGMAQGGELYILDMGEPVKIADLARDLIRLSGFEPEVDIPIKYVGLRPGEKLYEELLMDEEGINKTKHEKIFIGQPLDINYEVLKSQIESFEKVTAYSVPSEEAVEYLKKVVPTFVSHQ